MKDKPNLKSVKIKLVAPEWEVQAGENALNFNRFNQYLRLGNARSLTMVAKLELPEGKKLSNHISAIQNISQKYRWAERARLFEAHLQEQEIQDMINIRKERSKRLDEIAKEGESALRTIVKAYLKKYVNGKLDFDKIKPEKFIELLDRALGRLVDLGEFELKVAGEPTEIIHQKNENIGSVDLNLRINDMSHEELLKNAKELGFERNHKK
jgi:hypothetical protein